MEEHEMRRKLHTRAHLRRRILDVEPKQLLAQARSRRGETQAQAAKALGVATKTYRTWETGEVAVSLRYAGKMAEYCGMPLEDVLAVLSNDIEMADAAIGAQVARQNELVEMLLERFGDLETRLANIESTHNTFRADFQRIQGAIIDLQRRRPGG